MNLARLASVTAMGFFVAIFPAGWISTEFQEICREVAEEMSPGYDQAQVIKRECAVRAQKRTHLYYAVLSIAGAIVINSLSKKK